MKTLETIKDDLSLKFKDQIISVEVKEVET